MEKKKNTKAFIKYLTKTITTAFLIVLIAVGLFLLFVFLSAKFSQKKGTTPPVNLYTIISPSMTPNINVYDVVVAVRTNKNKLKVGDIISFYTNEVNVNGLTITHRIYQVIPNGDTFLYKTKGDYNQYVDKWTVKPEDIVGKVVFKIPQLGRVQFFLGTKGGWLIAILIPALGIIAYDIYKVIKLIFIRQKIINYQKEEDIEENNPDTISTIADLYREEKEDIINIDDKTEE